MDRRKWTGADSAMSLEKSFFDPCKRKPVILISRRGKRIEDGNCDVCGRPRCTVFQYPQSSWGEVSLCLYCKPEAFERSFEPSHIPDYVGGGNPGSGRRG